MNKHEPAKGQVSEAKFGEPWKLRKPDGQAAYDKDGNQIAYVGEHELTKRLIACVNALAGIDDPETWVKAHRELVEAVSAYCDYYGDDDVKFGELLGNMQTAIAACEAAEGRKE